MEKNELHFLPCRSSLLIRETRHIIQYLRSALYQQHMEDSIEAKVGVLYLIHFVQFSSTLGSSHIHPPSTYSIRLIVIPQAFTVSYLSQTVFWCFLSLSVIFTIMSQPGINIALLNQQNSLKCHYTLSRCSPDLGALLQLILDSLP